MDLTKKTCVACEGGIPSMNEEEIATYIKEVSEWEVAADNKKIPRELKFKDFVEAIAFINKVADLAESEGHHPDINVSYNKVRIELWTHAINGLSENDFILASKIDRLSSN